jgi:hypothetical protein
VVAAKSVPSLAHPQSRSLGSPPVEYCLGTSPIQEANSRPLRKAAPLPTAAITAVATKGPCQESVAVVDTPRPCASFFDILDLSVSGGNLVMRVVEPTSCDARRGGVTGR